MRRRLALVALALIVAATSGCAAMWQSEEATPAYAGDDSDAGYYYDDLAPYGTWMNVASYGWVWCPLDTPVGWSPYTVGYWLYSDDGWFWVSEDPWGATPYHYGRWAYDYSNGWFWVPGDVWAPAWVAWRCSDHWVGWAPLPPECTWRAGSGLSYSAYDLDEHIDQYRWSFMHARDFGTTRERVTVVPTSRNVTLIGRTKDVTKYEAGPRPIENGMRPELIQKSGQTIERYRIVDSKTPIRKTGATVGDQAIEVYRPNGGITAVVKERMRSTPPKERPVPSRALQNRVEREKVQLPDAVKAQRDELTKEHDQEMQDREPGASAVEMKRRQDAELKAQRDIEERQKRVLEERERRITKERKARPNAPETTPPPAQQQQEQAQPDPTQDDRGKARDERTKDRNIAPRVPDKTRDRGDQGR
jgi:Family of unknown function (DUF6600)